MIFKKYHLLLYFVFVFCFLCVNAQTSSGTARNALAKRRLRNRAVNITTTTSPPESQRLVEHETFDEQEEDGMDNQAVMTLLHKINDRLTSMQTLDDQQMRKLETFEYRITKLEVQIQEKTEGLRSDLKEVARRVQQLDWQSSKTESSLETLKSDTSFLKQAIEHFRITPLPDTNIGGGVGGGISTDMGLDISNKLQMALKGVQTLVNSVTVLHSDLYGLRRNVTKISNSSSTLDVLFPQLLTTKHFQRTLLDFEHRLYSPACHINSANLKSLSGEENERLPRDCSEVPTKISGVYRIQPTLAQAPFFAYCDMETNGGGWTVIQRRTEGTLEFYKEWHDYKVGFGNIGGEFWLGNEKIYSLTNIKVNEIYIELEDFSFEKTYAHYQAFAIGSEIEGYPISFLGVYDGTAGDSLLYHAGQKFSTFDVDHDNWPEGNCAQSHTGAWWYNGCDTSNLNGRYLNGELPDQYEYSGMYWYDWHGPKYSLKASKIMIRPYEKIQLPALVTEDDNF